MNKHILKCISNYDMKVEGSLAYGQIDGYEVNVLENKFGIGPIFLFSTYLTKEQKNIFVQNLLAKKNQTLAGRFLRFRRHGRHRRDDRKRL